MGYEELLRRAAANPQATVTVSLADLLSANREMFEMMRRDMMSGVHALYKERTLTCNQVCELLGVNRLTLSRWNKRGILKSHKVGGKLFYNISDVERLRGLQDSQS